MGPKVTRRTERLIVRELGDETIVYDLDNDQVHALSGAVAQVWKATDGGVSLTALSKSAGVDERTAAAAIDQLGEKNLLRVTAPAGMSRRQLMHRAGMVGGVALSLPAIESILAPTAAFAWSNTVAPDDLESAIGAFIQSHTANTTTNTATNFTLMYGPLVKSSYAPGTDFVNDTYVYVGPPTGLTATANTTNTATLTAGVYNWVVTALLPASADTGAGESVISNVQTQTATSSGAGSKGFALSWTAPAGITPTGYRVYRSSGANNTSYDKLGLDLAAGTLTYNDRGQDTTSATTHPPTGATAAYASARFVGPAGGTAIGSPVNATNATVTASGTSSNSVVIKYVAPGTVTGTSANVTYAATSPSPGATVQVVSSGGTVLDTQSGTNLSRTNFAVTGLSAGSVFYVVVGAASGTPGVMTLKLQVT